MRNKKLKYISFWTSGNRVYKCNNTKLVNEILNYRSKNSYKNCLTKFSANVNLLNFIEDIINKEYKEYGQYWD